MMRKLMHVLVALLLCIGSVYAGPADFFELTDSVHTDLAALYISQGLALPSTTLPYSRGELRFLLSRLDSRNLTPVESQIYERLLKKAEATPVAFSLNAEVALETYLHSNTEDFQSEDDWVYSYQQRKPLLALPVNISLGSVSGAIDLPLVSSNIGDEATVAALFGERFVGTNIPYDFISGESYLDANVPYRAFLAFGGEHYALQVGRDRLSWGPGFSGNFMIGDQLQYHNMARLIAYKDSFTYSFLVSFFPHPKEIYDLSSSLEGGQARELTGLKMFIGHRFEWRLFSDRIGLVLSEGIMYQNEDGLLDLRVMSPMMLYHNYFLRSQANSLATLELDYTFRKGWNLYSQFAVDEFAFGSTEWELESGRHPNGLAAMVGLRMERPMLKGFLRGHIEGVYTDPYLYLRSLDGDQSQSSDEDSLNYVVALRKWYSDHIAYDKTYLGYSYGGDAIVVSSSLAYRVPNEWYIKGHFFGMLHGEMNEESLWTLDDLRSTPTGEATFYTQTGISAGKMLGAWNLQCYLDFLTKSKGSSHSHDFQLVMSVSYTYD